ncbi:MAG: hypothetical protein ACYCX2_09305 [Christensenellales bacterium]
MKRLQIFIGNYGSGKTEIAINMAINASMKGRVLLIDLDIVNPYFRSSEKRELLEQHKITVISPPYAGTNVDLPVISPQVERAFVDKESAVFFDVGGDPVGATVLGMYSHRFQNEQPEVNYVINARRPLSSKPEDILEMIGETEARSRLKVTALINNTNLAKETTADDLMYGQEIVAICAKSLQLPVRFVCGRPDVLGKFLKMGTPVLGEPYPINIYMRPDWLDM